MDIETHRELLSEIADLKRRCGELENAMARVLQAVPSAASAAALAHEQVLLRLSADMLASIGTKTIDMPAASHSAAAQSAPFAVGDRVQHKGGGRYANGTIIAIDTEPDGWIVVRRDGMPADDKVCWLEKNTVVVQPAPAAATGATFRLGDRVQSTLFADYPGQIIEFRNNAIGICKPEQATFVLVKLDDGKLEHWNMNAIKLDQPALDDDNLPARNMTIRTRSEADAIPCPSGRDHHDWYVFGDPWMQCKQCGMKAQLPVTDKAASRAVFHAMKADAIRASERTQQQPAATAQPDKDSDQ
jgi:hypothetical protein